MALYEDHILLLLVPRTVSILSSTTPVICTFRQHPKCCVKKRLFREYYRHRLFPEIVPFMFSKGECYACPQEQAYHIKPGRFNGRTLVTRAAPSREEFRQHVRRLAVSAVQVLIEHVMREELEQCIGASWGECTPTRRGYRNSSYIRDLVTPTGHIEDLNVPRDRAGKFHSQVFERYSRYEPEVAEALTQMFVSGVSTHKVGEVAQTLLGVAPSASAGRWSEPDAGRAV